MKVIIKTGKRKRAIARATLKPGKGIVKINRMDLHFYSQKLPMMKIMEPLMLAGDTAHKVNISINVNGGGFNSQAEASRVAMCKALVEFAPRLKEVYLKYDRNFLVSDVRRKESSKPNSHGQARAKVQKSYR